MEYKINNVYKDEHGEYFKTKNKDGEMVLYNPSYPFVFRLGVMKVQLVGHVKEFGHLVKKKDYGFYEGNELILRLEGED